MSIIEKIHTEFDTAVEKLIDVSKKELEKANSIVDPTVDTQLIEDGKFLQEIGFENVDLAKETSKFKNLISKNKNNKKTFTENSYKIKSVVEKYSNIFPFHKFILYSQVINILEKYNLFIGHSSLYKGSIPKKNIEEIKNFPFDKIPPFRLNIKDPLFKSDGITSYKGESGNKKIYICAPKEDFNTKGSAIVGNEIIKDQGFKYSFREYKDFLKSKKVKDPIILLPVGTPLNMLGFIIITKWGLEANDPALTVPINN